MESAKDMENFDYYQVLSLPFGDMMRVEVYDESQNDNTKEESKR